MLKQIKEVIPLVISVLQEYPDTRNSDKELILKCWEKEGLILTPEQQIQFKACHSTETYRRTRQKIQEAGEFGATKAVRQQRLKNDVEMRNALAGKRVVIEGNKAIIVEG